MTNKKRAPGAGRKPKGPITGNSGWLQARITEDLRDQLEKAAAQNGRSLSQEAQVRLKNSFGLQAKLQKAWGPSDVQALAYLVSRVVRSVHWSVGANPFTDAGDLAWHRNSFTHEAVQVAITALLAHYKPAAPIEAPAEVTRSAERFGPDHAKAAATPEGVGHMVALGLLNQLSMSEPPPKKPEAGVHYSESRRILPDIRSILGETDDD